MRRSVDLFTLIAIAVVVYIIANIIHEAAGHGGACVLMGGTPLSVSTSYFDGDCHGNSLCTRVEASAGTIMNLLLGIASWIVCRNIKFQNDSVRLFWWLSLTVNLLLATGYPLFSGVMNVGDWVTVVKGYQPVWLWRMILIVTGALLYLLSIFVSLSELTRLVGRSDPERVQTASRLSFLPYIYGSALSTIGSFFNPISPALILTSAAAHFGGTSAMAWMAQLLNNPKHWRANSVAHDEIRIPRSVPWIVIASVLLAFHIFVLGPSVKF